MTVARAIVVALLAAGAAVMVVRSAFVAAYSSSNPQRAVAAWPDHPAAVFPTGLARIGEAAAAGRPVSGDIIDPLLRAARAAPLAPEPFLVRGVQLRVAGDEAAAGRAFAEAKRRDPRSIPARFFLADHHLRANSVEPGLEEIAVLAGLVPGSAGRIAPVLAGYAQTPGAAGQIKRLLRAHPELEPGLLDFLAADVRNADLVFALASGRRLSSGDRPGWHAGLVEGLAAAGQYDRAYEVWARLMGGRARTAARPLLFDPRFEKSTALRPFAWGLVSSSAGLVEPEQGGLHIIYYGRDNMTLASQLLLLAPGRYELAMRIANGGDEASALAWTITCIPSKKLILSVDLARVAATSGSGQRFDVSATGCAAQQLELIGKAPEFPQTVDLSLSRLTLSRAAR